MSICSVCHDGVAQFFNSLTDRSPENNENASDFPHILQKNAQNVENQRKVLFQRKDNNYY